MCRTMRYYRGMESMRLVSLRYDSDTIIVTVEKSNKQRYHFEAGQFGLAFLLIYNRTILLFKYTIDFAIAMASFHN